MARSRDFLVIPLTLAVTVFGLLWGGRNAYVSIRNHSPLELTCADMIENPPDAEWVRLRDCEPDFEHMGVETKGRKGSDFVDVTSVFIPLHAAGASWTRQNKLVVVISDGPLLELGRKRIPDEEATYAYATEQLTQPIEGMIELSVDRSHRERTELRGLGMRLAEDFSIIDRHARPRPLWLSLGVLAIGVVGLSLIGRRLRRWLRNGPEPLAKATVVRE